jgi:hypothetical protein
MIVGYIIVRKPQHNEITHGRSLEPISNIYYHGMDRLMWYDLESNLLEGKFPDDLKLKHEQLVASENDLTFTKVLKSFEDSKRFLSTSRNLIERNEIIAINSNALIKIKGGMSVPGDLIEWLGYDVVLLGGWSLIKHGVFENRQLSLVDAKRLNKYGLFDDVDGIDKFLAEYERLALRDKVDPLLSKNIILDFVNVGRLKNG